MEILKTNNPCTVCGCDEEVSAVREVVRLSACADCGIVRCRLDTVEQAITRVEARKLYEEAITKYKIAATQNEAYNQIVSETIDALTGRKAVPVIKNLVNKLLPLEKAAGMTVTPLEKRLEYLEEIKDISSNLYGLLDRIDEASKPKELSDLADKLKGVLLSLNTLDKALYAKFRK